MRFGESFPQGADPKNRMDVLSNADNRMDNPSYIKFGLEIRNKLKSKIEKDAWPDMPKQEQINITEDIFEAAKQEVDKAWEDSIEGLLTIKINEWKNGLNGNDPEVKAAYALLDDPVEFKKNFSLYRFGVLETLRPVNPDAWRSLVMASSERQLASVALMEHWLKNSSQENLEAVCAKIGLSLEEFKLFIDTAAILGKYIDHAYVKQIELADLPGGSEETKLSQEDGAPYFYDLYKDSKSEDVDIKTYTDIFPYEWDKIQSRLELLSLRTQMSVEAGKLPDSYKEFSAYLQKAAQTYGSKSINPEVLEKEWDDLYKMAKTLDDGDCSIMLVTQGSTSVAGEAAKIDAEIRLGLKTKETKKQEKSFYEFSKTAQVMLDNYRSFLNKDYKIPQVNLNYQPWAFGPNLFWMTRGESGEDQILSHTNAVVEVAVVQEIPLLKSIFRNEKINDKEYTKAAVLETVLHETGHNVLDSSDKKISKRIGMSFEAGILEELKAETVGIKILQETALAGNLPQDITIKNQLLAKLGTNFDYLKNKSDKKTGSDEPYYICGATIIGRLLEKGLIKETGDTYEITNYENCLAEIVSISDRVLSFYTDNQIKPADVKGYIKELRIKAQSPKIKDFIKKL